MLFDDPNVMARLATDGIPSFSNRSGARATLQKQGRDPWAQKQHLAHIVPRDRPGRVVEYAHGAYPGSRRWPSPHCVASELEDAYPTALANRFINSVHSNNHPGRRYLAIPPLNNGNTEAGARTMHVKDLQSYEVA